jgi:hypothetical protein
MSPPAEKGCQLRLYGMMQYLISRLAVGEALPPRPTGGGIVDTDVAKAAILSLGALIDAAVQAGQLGPDQGAHAGALLMLIREYVEPLPTTVPLDEQLELDLAEMAAEMRTAHQLP